MKDDFHKVFEGYRKLDKGLHLDAADCRGLRQLKPLPVQLASMAIRIMARRYTRTEEKLLRWIAKKHPRIGTCLRFLDPCSDIQVAREAARPDSRFLKSLKLIRARREIGSNSLRWIAIGIREGWIPIEHVAIWLTCVFLYGLTKSDTMNLTFAMKDSGQVHDYRKSKKLDYRRILRRYPTGGLSEKQAIILPALISAFCSSYGIASTYLVAKALAFTGGTYDKLRSIRRFRFREPGSEVILALRKCGIAMLTADEHLDPLDNILYQIRSLTCTVESTSLMLSSIASKHLALPPDLLLLDVRYGEDAFLRNIREAKAFSRSIVETLRRGGVPCTVVLKENREPNGMAIGNALEVVESLAVMSGNLSELWDERALEEQRQLVAESFAILMNLAFPKRSRLWWKKEAVRCFGNDKVIEAFYRILTTHGVSKKTISLLKKDPFSAIGADYKPIRIHSKRDGRLTRIDQRTLGELVNFSLGAGGNEFGGERNDRAGVILKKRLSDNVRTRETICLLYSPLREDQVCHLIARIRDCFIIT